MSRRCRQQRGFAMIAVVLLVVLISSYLLVKALNRTSSEVFNARQQRTMDALRQAKTALIAYAASTEGWQTYKGQSTNQPGGLPCPDNNDDGTSAGALCSGIQYRLGRLPWATIGSEDFRDASGERLWYAVSSNFYKSSNNVINSDTQGLLTVTGATPASNIIAIVFAPGPPLASQDRSTVTGHNSAAAYLEQFTTVGNDYVFNSSTSSSSTYNDQLLVITQADLMAAVEPVVAARMDRDVKPFLQAYFTQWGRFPFPAQFASPDPGTNGSGMTSPQNTYTGNITQTSGLLPITASLAYQWASGSGSVSLVSGTAVISNVSCTTVPSSSDSPATGPGWQCSFWLGPATITTSAFSFFCFCMRYTVTSLISDPRLNVQGGVTNAGISYAQLPDASTVGNSHLPSSAPTPPATNGTPAADGSGTAKYQATYSSLNCSISVSQNFTPPPPPSPPCPTYTDMRVTIPNLAPSLVTSNSTSGTPISAASNASPIAITTGSAHNLATGAAVALSGIGGNTAANGNWTVTVTDSTHFTLNGSTGNGNYTSGGTVLPASLWFVQNEWFRQTYYAVSPGFLPGSVGACSPLPGTPSCLTVNNMPPDYPAPNNDKRVILILAGRALNGSTRPSPNIANYLEGQNATPNDFIFEHRQGSPTSINDRIVVVSP